MYLNGKRNKINRSRNNGSSVLAAIREQRSLILPPAAPPEPEPGATTPDIVPDKPKSSYVQVGKNCARVCDSLKGRGDASSFVRTMSAIPSYLPSGPENQILDDSVAKTAGPMLKGDVRYPGFTSQYQSSFASFATQNKDLIDQITADDYPFVLAMVAHAYSYAHTTEISIVNHMVKRTRNRSLMTPKALAHLGCRRDDRDGNNFTVRDTTGKWLLDYEYKGDSHADKEFFLHFVRARMATEVKDPELEKLMRDPGMEKYITMGNDEMLKDEGPRALKNQREYRTQTLHSHSQIKMAMTTTSTLPCTADKFNFPDADPGDGLVIVYGSGASYCAMRYNWRNTFCVDPLFEGPAGTGFKGTHTEFHRLLNSGLLRLPGGVRPGLIASDACAYIDQRRSLLVGARGNHDLANLTRSMDPEKTNTLSSEIVEYWHGRGYTGDFIMKSGVNRFYPEVFSVMHARGFIKTRPTNAEVVVHLSGAVAEPDPGLLPTPGPELSWARAVNRQNKVIYVANYQRMAHEKLRTFPSREIPFSFPTNMEKLLANARHGAILPPPREFAMVNKRDLVERKRMVRGVDLDDLEHSSDRTSGDVDDESDDEDYLY